MANSLRSLTLPGRFRIKRRADFAALQGKGKKIYSPNFLIFVRDGLTTASRLGITVSKRVDKRAVVRNRIKRHVREAFRRLRPELARNVDIVVIARSSALDLSGLQVRDELQVSFTRGRLLKREKNE